MVLKKSELRLALPFLKPVTLYRINKFCVYLYSAFPPVNLSGRINGVIFLKKIRTEPLKRWSVGHVNRVVGLMGFSDRRMCGFLLGPSKSGRNKGVVV